MGRRRALAPSDQDQPTKEFGESLVQHAVRKAGNPTLLRKTNTVVNAGQNAEYPRSLALDLGVPSSLNSVTDYELFAK